MVAPFSLAFSGSTNDAPTVANTIADQTWSGSGIKSFQVPANTFVDTDGDILAYTATLADGSPLPAWLTFDPATRTFSGNPPNGVTTLALKVIADDGHGGTGAAPFNLAFSGSTNDAPTVANTIVDQTWSGSGIKSFQVSANTFADADGDILTYTATLANGSPLPAWLTFDPVTRTFTGNPPAEITNFSLKVTVSDGYGGSASSTFNLVFSGPTNDPPSVASPIVPQSWSGSGTWTFQVPAGTFTTDGYGLTYTATLDDGSILPSWLTFDPTTRTFSGNPPNGVTTLALKVIADDGHGGTSNTIFTLNLSKTNNPPVATNGALTVSGNTVGTGTLNATDPDGGTLTYSIVTNGKKGSVVLTDPATGKYTYTPNSLSYGSDSFTFKVFDGVAYSDIQTVTVFVSPAVSFSSPKQKVLEGSNAQVELLLTQPVDLDVSVPYTIAGNASEGSDFTDPLPVNTATIAAGKGSVLLSVPIANHSGANNNKNIVLSMGIPVNAQAGTIATHAITIVGTLPAVPT
ncbi:MAG: putative Ig domain-containing protein [Magnetococcales bacterium]|nr:putative Ig domain-containing protein [Magnetococcales bacterium]